MSEIKTILGAVSLILVFFVYFPYIKDILKGNTKPHVFSWFIWGITTFIIYALQLKAGAGPGSWATLLVGAIMFLVFFLGLRQGSKNIKPIDVFFLVLTLIALLFWLLSKQAVVSIILLATVEMLGFIPTFRKSYVDPHSEILPPYVINIFRQLFSLSALAEYSIVTWLIPVSWMIANTIFVIMLTMRRRNKAKSMIK